MRDTMRRICTSSSSCLFVQAHMPKDEPQREVVSCFECSSQDEGQPKDEQRPLQQQTGKDRAGGGAYTACQGGHASCCCALFRGDQGHRIGLPGGNIHL